MKKSISYPIFFMVAVTAFFTAILAFLNYSTIDTIKLNQQTKVRKKLLYAFDIETKSDDPETIKNTYDEHITEKEFDDRTIYIGKKGNSVLGYAFKVDGNALWGSVKGFAAVSKDFSKILGIDFVSHSETPGLGGRIDEEWFKSQFRDIPLDPTREGKFIAYRPSPSGNVDAIAGATLTSVAVQDFLNTDLKEFLAFVKEVNINGQ